MGEGATSEQYQEQEVSGGEEDWWHWVEACPRVFSWNWHQERFQGPNQDADWCIMSILQSTKTMSRQWDFIIGQLRYPETCEDCVAIIKWQLTGKALALLQWMNSE